MSKMTQRRISRRAARKINVLTRENKRETLRGLWLSQNLGEALKGLERANLANKELRAKVAA